MKLADVKKLQQKKYRDQFGYFLVEGEHLLLELEKAARFRPALRTSELLVTDNHQHWPGELKKTLISKRQMAQISGTSSPQGLLAIVPCAAVLNPQHAAESEERAIYLHEIQDPGNLGTIMRSLAWFGGFRCLLSPNSVDPFNPKVVRASMGAVFHLPMELNVPLSTLPGRFTTIACLDMQGLPLSDTRFKSHACYLFGNEARGLPQEQLAQMPTQAFTIPGCGAIESLNLASVVSLCVYELLR